MHVAVMDPLVGLRISIERALGETTAHAEHPSDPGAWLHDVADGVVVITVLGDDDLARVIELAAARRGGVVALVADDVPAHLAALAAGATAAVARSETPERIAQVVRAAAAGDCLLSAELANELATHAPPHPRVPLSDEEVDWIRALARGSTVSHLADQVGYSEREMYRLLADVYDRMGARDRIDAIVTAARLGLVDG